MAHSFELKVEKRHNTGNNSAKRLRREQKKVPAIVYGAKKPPESIALSHDAVVVALNNEAVYSHILTLKFEDNKTEKVVLKDLQRNPGNPMKILHMDFFRVSAAEELSMSVPIHFINPEKAPGVVKSAGVVSHIINELEIKCLPANLPEYIEVDIGALKLNDTIHLSEIKLPKGVKLASPIQDEEHDLSVVTILMPRIEKEAPSGDEIASAGQEASVSASEEGAGTQPAGNTPSDKKE
jgi:large subunit ribosomal protein L25